MESLRSMPAQPTSSIPPTPTDSNASSSSPPATKAQPQSHSFPTPVSASSPEKPRRFANLQSLPRDVLADIAYHLVVEDDVGHHPRDLLSLLLTCKQISYAISFDHHPQLYHDLFRATFDWAAIQRRYDWMKQHLASNSKGAPKTFDLFEDPRAWATDYKTRWDLARRSKYCPRPSGEITPEEKEQFGADLWVFWFLLTENDGKNYCFLMDEMDMYGLMWYWFSRYILPMGMVPGYPPDDGLAALGLWCAILSGADLRRPYNAPQTDEKIFWLRPYIFACFKYDISYAPWQHRQLPLCAPNCREHEPDVTMQSRALPYKRFGYTWRRAPPPFVLGAYLMLLRVMEKHKRHVIASPLTSRFTETSGPDEPGLFTSHEILSSLNHDREWQRNSVCQDPHTSFGLPALAFKGQMEGFWRGNFIHYSLDMYRKILAGDLRTLYTADFSLQAAEMELKETIVKVRKDQVGGQGSVLDAGFEGDADDREREQHRILEGYGHDLAQSDEPDEEGWTKEILLSGMCRMIIGNLYVRGRIRGWDGLVLLSIQHENMSNATSKWLWRGYIKTGGYYIGRWRDTFTPANFRGYEGGFAMVRAGTHHYPPSFPVRMNDSLGLTQDETDGTQFTDPDTQMDLNPGPIPPQVEFSQGSREPERGESRGSATTGHATTITSMSMDDGASSVTSTVESPMDMRDGASMNWHGSTAEPVESSSESNGSLKRSRAESEDEEYTGKGKSRARD